MNLNFIFHIFCQLHALEKFAKSFQSIKILKIVQLSKRMRSWTELMNEVKMKVNTCSETATVILLLLAYLEECSSEFSDHGWVHPYALLHDRRETAKRYQW